MFGTTLRGPLAGRENRASQQPVDDLWL